MANYNIPKEDLKGFVTIAGLSQATLAKLTNAIENAPVGLLPKELTENLASKVDLKRELLTQIIEIVYAINGIKVKENKTSESITKDVLESIKLTNPEFKLSAPALRNLNTNLTKLLSFDGSLALTLKSHSLSVEYERVYLSSRIMTDIRPVFTELKDKMDAAILVHSLKLKYRINNESKSVFLTLTSKELKELKEHIIRAEKKEDIIKKSIGKQIKFIDISKN